GSQELQSYLQQKPNQRILGTPFSLLIYNLGNPDTLSVQWPDSKPVFKNWFSKKFSEKQLNALQRTSKGFNKWLLKSGNAPVISDPAKIKKSVSALERYYFNNGFWDATASFKEFQKENKKTSIEYSVITGDPYFLDSISTNIASPVLDSVYQLNKDKSFLTKGEQYRYENFENEEDRLVNLFRNSGVYHFGKNIMGFDIDTTYNKEHKQNVELTIPDRLLQQGDSIYREPYKIQKIKEVNVYTDFSFNTKDQPIRDSASYNKINFYSIDKLKYNPRYLANSIIIEPGGVYKDSERDLTRRYLRDLQNFRPSVDIKYEENSDETLTANVFLTPLKKYSLGWDTEFTTSNIKPFGILGKLSFLNRNVFRGAEIFELSFQGSFLNTAIGADGNNESFFNALEIGSSASLKIPRILFPFNTSKIIPKRMTPKTNISLSLGFQENIGLDRQNITGGIDYTWQSSKTTSHKFELLNVQYINNRNEENYFNVYRSELSKLNQVAFDNPPNNELNTIPPDPVLELGDEIDVQEASTYINYVLFSGQGFENSQPEEFAFVQNIEQQREILIEDVLVPVISYGITYNNRESFRDNSFSTFSGRLISSGTITAAFINKTNENDRKVLFGLPVAQYLKTELEHKKYWSFNQNSTLVLRNFIGVAIPFGNSDAIPFSRSYRAGGSNDIRAWRTFDLGPGSELSTLEFNVGNLKFTSNLEYRFKLINSLNAALFVDAGNIWDISDSPVSSSEAKFTGFNSIKDIAIGSGFGARYDFSFLIFRFDIGFKTYEPYLQSSTKWFKNYNFNKAIYNIGINYPF
nr:BamA/TamA family outer membrane protein [Flavobacteriaceae bacterium]